MQNHVSKVARTCFYHIRRLKQVRKLLGPDVAAKLVASLVFSRLDYCNAVLAGLPSEIPTGSPPMGALNTGGYLHFGIFYQ